MTRITLIFLFLMAASVNGADWNASWSRGADSTEITAGGQTASTHGTTGAFKVYYLTGDITSAGNGLTIACDSCAINLQGHTITFDNDSGGSAAGLLFGGGNDYVEVKRGNITQFETATEISNGCYGGSTVQAITTTGNLNWVTIRNINAHTYGENGGVIAFNRGGEHQGVKIYTDPDSGWIAGDSTYGDITPYSVAFDSRMDPTVFGMRGGNPKRPADTFNYYVSNMAVTNSAHCGIIVGGVAWVDSCDVTIDAHNESGLSFANAHAIADAGYCDEGSRFRYNKMRCGTSHYGGRGMYFNGGKGTAENPIEVAYNDIRVHLGYVSDDEDAAARPIRMRWHNQHFNIHHNKFYAEVDDDAGTAYRFHEGYGFMFGSDDEGDFANTGYTFMDTSSQFCHFWSNDCRVIWYGDPPAEWNYKMAGAIVYHLDHPDRPGYNDGNMSWDNAFRGYGPGIIFGSEQGGAHCEGWLSICDTFINTNGTDTIESAADTAWSLTFCSGPDGAMLAGWGIGTNVSDVHIINPVMINPTWDDIKSGNGSGAKSVKYARIVQVTVVDSNSAPIEGAVVNFAHAIAGGGDTTKCDTTNASGVVIDTLDIRHIMWDDGCTESRDSTYSITFSADYGAVGLDSTRTLNTDLQEGGTVTISLELATDGGQEPDPPAAANHRRKGGKVIGGKIR